MLFALSVLINSSAHQLNKRGSYINNYYYYYCEWIGHTAQTPQQRKEKGKKEDICYVQLYTMLDRAIVHYGEPYSIYQLYFLQLSPYIVSKIGSDILLD